MKEFVNHKPNCIVCNGKNLMIMTGSIREEIGESETHCIFNSMLPVFRKDFMTFAMTSHTTFSSDDFLDIDTLHKEKYETLLISKDGYVSFDYDFNFRIKFQFRVFCPMGHYSYESRFIRVSNESPDITKGYPITNEALVLGEHRVISNNVDNTTSIFNLKTSKDPIIVPYMAISTFPYDDMDKFAKRIENILLLA